MIASGLPLRCVSINAAGGYDTHADQEASLPENLQITTQSLLAFQRDLEARGIADRVLVNVWSEFGRRPEENGSGTDHGAAGCSFLIGSQASGQMVGEFPGLTSSTRTTTCAPRRTSAASTAACSSSGSAWTPAPIIPNASQFTPAAAARLKTRDCGTWTGARAGPSVPAMAFAARLPRRARASASRCRPRGWRWRTSTPPSWASAARWWRRRSARLLLLVLRQPRPRRDQLGRLALVALGVVVGLPAVHRARPARPDARPTAR